MRLRYIVLVLLFFVVSAAIPWRAFAKPFTLAYYDLRVGGRGMAEKDTNHLKSVVATIDSMKMEVVVHSEDHL